MIIAAQVLDGLAGLLGGSSEALPDLDQRARRAALFRRIALVLPDGHW